MRLCPQESAGILTAMPGARTDTIDRLLRPQRHDPQRPSEPEVVVAVPIMPVPLPWKLIAAMSVLALAMGL